MVDYRNRRVKKSQYYDAMDSDRVIWHVQVNEWKFLVWTDNAVHYEGYGPDVILSISRPGGALRVNLSNFSHDELKTARELFDKMFDLLDDYTLGRDKRAEELEQELGITFQRLYRGIPRLASGPGAVGADSESLLGRPVNVFAEDESDSDSEG